MPRPNSSEPPSSSLPQFALARHHFFRPYGLWFAGLREMLLPLAIFRTDASVLPIFSPMTLVGVFSPASRRTAATSVREIRVPELRVLFDILCLLLIAFIHNGVAAIAAGAIDVCLGPACSELRVDPLPNGLR